MSYPAKYPPAVTPVNWNAMVDRVNGYTPSGIFVSPYKYVISTDGTYYYANNAFQTLYGGSANAGGVDGTDPNAVIQAALDNLTAGRTWKETVKLVGTFPLVYADTYTYDGYDSSYGDEYCLLMPSYAILDLIDAKITCSVTGVSNIIAIHDVLNVEVKGGSVVGARDAGEKNACIGIYNSHDVIINGVFMSKTKVVSGAHGVSIDSNNPTAAVTAYNVCVQNCCFTEIGDYAIYVGHSKDCKILNNYMYTVQKGITVSWQSYNHIIAGNHIKDTSSFGIYLQTEAYHNLVCENVLENVNEAAILLYIHCYRNSIIGNMIISPVKSGVRIYAEVLGTYPAARAYCSDGFSTLNLVENNFIRATTTHGIELNAANAMGNYYNIIQGNFMHNCQQYSIYESEATGGVVGYNLIKNNYINTEFDTILTLHSTDRVTENAGYVTENNGNSAITSGNTTVDVTHGLSYTPLKSEISITPSSLTTNNVGLYGVSTCTDTLFTVFVSADPGTSGFNFHWSVRRI